MASKDKVLRLLQEKHKAKLDFVCKDLNKQIDDLTHTRDHFIEKTKQGIRDLIAKERFTQRVENAEVTFHVSLVDPYVHSGQKPGKNAIKIKSSYLDELNAAIESLKKEKQQKLYRINSDYDRLNTIITIEGLSPELTKAIKDFVDFGWVRFWKGWKDEQ